MPKPPARQTPATELEQKIAEGDLSAVGVVVDELDEPLHRHLAAEFPRLLSEEDREDLIAKFIMDLIESPTMYDARRASLKHFAKLCTFRRAIDLLRRRETRFQYELGVGAAAVLRLATDDPSDSVEFDVLCERAKVAAATMDPKHRAALEAYWRHGSTGYKRALVEDHGITADLAATWLSRAKKALEEELDLRVLEE